MIKYVHGSLLDSDCNYICHQVNCQGKMNSGVAKFVREKWPEVFALYTHYVDGASPDDLLGRDEFIPINPNQQVVNMFAQRDYGYDGRRYTSYDAFWRCLVGLRQDTPASATYAFPRKIGSDRGGANWNVIRTMINEVLGDREVYIYTLDGEED